jgi:hypothetical protein
MIDPVLVSSHAACRFRERCPSTRGDAYLLIEAEVGEALREGRHAAALPEEFAAHADSAAHVGVREFAWTADRARCYVLSRHHCGRQPDGSWPWAVKTVLIPCEEYVRQQLKALRERFARAA